ncbi:cytochrome P450 [Streptomyces sp. NPDC002577]
MTAPGAAALDPARIQELFDLRATGYTSRGGDFSADPYPAFKRLRETGPVHPGIVGPLVGYHGEAFFQGLPFPDRPHVSAFDYATCDEVLRDSERFSASPAVLGEDAALYETSMLYMDGQRHRNYRTLVQPSFLPRRMRWWVENWITSTVDALLDTIEANGRADLNVEFFAPIPLLTICGSLGVDVRQALDIRAVIVEASADAGRRFMEIVQPLVTARRADPGDDLLSTLVQAEVADEDGTTHALSDRDVLSFAYLLLAAGSGTTWKQMGITLLALFQHPHWLAESRRDPAVLRAAVDESLRWMPTDPVFARFAREDGELRGVPVPAGSVVHVCLAEGNRDPGRWERPDEFDPSRPPRANLGFGAGPHICLGMHVARTEIATAIGALLERFPDVRRDPDAEAPRITGMYERGPTAVPVVWGRPA